MFLRCCFVYFACFVCFYAEAKSLSELVDDAYAKVGDGPMSRIFVGKEEVIDALLKIDIAYGTGASFATDLESLAVGMFKKVIMNSGQKPGDVGIVGVFRPANIESVSISAIDRPVVFGGYYKDMDISMKAVADKTENTKKTGYIFLINNNRILLPEDFEESNAKQFVYNVLSLKNPKYKEYLPEISVAVDRYLADKSPPGSFTKTSVLYNTLISLVSQNDGASASALFSDAQLKIDRTGEWSDESIVAISDYNGFLRSIGTQHLFTEKDMLGMLMSKYSITNSDVVMLADNANKNLADYSVLASHVRNKKIDPGRLVLVGHNLSIYSNWLSVVSAVGLGVPRLPKFAYVASGDGNAIASEMARVFSVIAYSVG